MVAARRPAAAAERRKDRGLPYRIEPSQGETSAEAKANRALSLLDRSREVEKIVNHVRSARSGGLRMVIVKGMVADDAEALFERFRNWDREEIDTAHWEPAILEWPSGRGRSIDDLLREVGREFGFELPANAGLGSGDRQTQQTLAIVHHVCVAHAISSHNWEQDKELIKAWIELFQCSRMSLSNKRILVSFFLLKLKEDEEPQDRKLVEFIEGVIGRRFTSDGAGDNGTVLLVGPLDSVQNGDVSPWCRVAERRVDAGLKDREMTFRAAFGVEPLRFMRAAEKLREPLVKALTR